MSLSERLSSIIYVLDSPKLNGGVKVVFQHAQMLYDYGYQVRVLGNGEAPDWIEFAFEYIDYSSQSTTGVYADLVVATYWTTIKFVEKINSRKIIHFCQGYEADHPHLQNKILEIKFAYQKPYSCLVISPHLKIFLKEKYGKQCEVASPPIDAVFKCSSKKSFAQLPKIIIHGIYECTWKGVPCGLEVVKKLKESGLNCELIRISLFPITETEKAQLTADRYVIGEPPEVIAKVIKQACLLIFPSHPAEGFGLPLLEAMACGVPFVATDIPSVRNILKQDASIDLLQVGDVEGFYEEARKILSNPLNWDKRRAQGLLLANAYHWDTASRQLVDSIEKLYHYDD